jgi:hypothetical protein
MYFLFECGFCANLYQIQIEKISTSLHKVICPSCQNFHYFGAPQEKTKTNKPTIEKVGSSHTKNLGIEASTDQKVSQELFWKCGICEENYNFNLNQVSGSGTKISCTTCFNFFILQQLGAMVDLDHMVIHEWTPDQKTPREESQTKETILIKKETIAPVAETPAPKPVKKEKTKEKAKPLTNPTMTIAQSPTSQPKHQVEDDLIMSFHSYRVQKPKYKINPEHSQVSIAFIESDHVPKTKFVKNMWPISLWIIGISTFSLAVVFTVDYFKDKKAAKIQKQQEESYQPPPPSANSDKPRYGFPTMEE